MLALGQSLASMVFAFSRLSHVPSLRSSPTTRLPGHHRAGRYRHSPVVLGHLQLLRPEVSLCRLAVGSFLSVSLHGTYHARTPAKNGCLRYLLWQGRLDHTLGQYVVGPIMYILYATARASDTVDYGHASTGLGVHHRSVVPARAGSSADVPESLAELRTAVQDDTA